MGEYKKEYRLLSSDVDLYRRLRLSRLYTMLQEASIAHTTELGMGRDKTLDRGLLWIITVQEARISRLPEYDEDIILSSRPGATMHLFFPRYYKLESRSGETLVEASALWALMEASSRRIVFPEEHGIVIDGEPGPIPRAPRLAAAEAETSFTVPYSYADLNGHMNNTRYLDLAEDIMPPELRAGRIRRIETEYAAEARPGDLITLKYGSTGNTFSLSGETDRRIFRLKTEYWEE